MKRKGEVRVEERLETRDRKRRGEERDDRSRAGREWKTSAKAATTTMATTIAITTPLIAPTAATVTKPATATTATTQNQHCYFPQIVAGVHRAGDLGTNRGTQGLC